MYILDSAQKTIHNSDFIERYTIVAKEDAVLICAALSMDKPLLTLGKYESEEEARRIIAELLAELGRGANYYEMPDSPLFHEQREIKDRRIRRRGGS